MKTCVTCKHMRRGTDGPKCGRKPMKNSITGETFYFDCAAERTDTYRSRFLPGSSACGSKGRFWEPAEPVQVEWGSREDWESAHWTLRGDD